LPRPRPTGDAAAFPGEIAQGTGQYPFGFLGPAQLGMARADHDRRLVRQVGCKLFAQLGLKSCRHDRRGAIVVGRERNDELAPAEMCRQIFWAGQAPQCLAGAGNEAAGDRVPAGATDLLEAGQREGDHTQSGAGCCGAEAVGDVVEQEAFVEKTARRIKGQIGACMA